MSTPKEIAAQAETMNGGSSPATATPQPPPQPASEEDRDLQLNHVRKVVVDPADEAARTKTAADRLKSGASGTVTAPEADPSAGPGEETREIIPPDEHADTSPPAATDEPQKAVLPEPPAPAPEPAQPRRTNNRGNNRRVGIVLAISLVLLGIALILLIWSAVDIKQLENQIGKVLNDNEDYKRELTTRPSVEEVAKIKATQAELSTRATAMEKAIATAMEKAIATAIENSKADEARVTELRQLNLELRKQLYAAENARDDALAQAKKPAAATTTTVVTQAEAPEWTVKMPRRSVAEIHRAIRDLQKETPRAEMFLGMARKRARVDPDNLVDHARWQSAELAWSERQEQMAQLTAELKEAQQAVATGK